MVNESPSPKSAPADAGNEEVTVGLATRRGPAFLIVGAVAALLAVLYWSTRPPPPPPDQTASVAAAAIDAMALEGPQDSHPELIQGQPPGTPNVDVPLAPTIVCRVLIDDQGKVSDARVYRPRLDLASFEEEALRAIKTYVFKPAVKDGRPVAVWINWPITFVNAKAPPERKIRIKGSDTIGGALAPALGTAYSAINENVEIVTEALGSSTAFVGLFDGSADIGASSRLVNPTELANARKLGVELQEFVIGYDGIAIIVHQDNPLKDLTVAQAGRIFRGEVVNWNEFGWYDLPIHLISHPNYSGTHSEFKHKVLRGGDAEAPGDFSPNTEYVESSDQISKMVAKDKTAISYVGLGWVGPRVKILGLSPRAGEPGVKPTEETVRSGDYPLFRPLLMYTVGVPSQTTANFLRFVVSPPGRDIVADSGFVPPGAAIAIPSRPDDNPDPSAPEVERVYFAHVGQELDASSLLQLEELAERLVAAGDRKVLIVGNVDAGGGRNENLETSYRRAEIVARNLESHGVPTTDIEIEAAESQQPISSNMTAAGRTANRRADIFITKRGAATVVAPAEPDQVPDGTEAPSAATPKDTKAAAPIP